MTGAAVTGPLLERSGELARIESALTEARNGSGTFVVIEGSAGIGKTSLLAATRAAALGSGMRVLRARPTELEREFAFGVVRQLFEPALVDASDAERAELLEGAAGVAAGLLGLGGRATVDVRRGSEVDHSFAILHGLYWLCANLAVAGPLCVVVDDAQWADAPSLRYLAFLVTRLEELSVTLLVATRPSDPGVDPELLATLMAAPSADVVRLHPLTRTAVAQLLESALEDVPDPAFVDACLRTTRGTPFLVGELVVALRGGGITPTAQAARKVERIGARSIGRSIQLRLGRLPDSAIRWHGRSPFSNMEILSTRLAWRNSRWRRRRTQQIDSPKRESSNRVCPWSSSTRSFAAASTKGSPAPSVRKRTGAPRTCSPSSRSRARASPSTC